jgi:hypothetical protein
VSRYLDMAVDQDPLAPLKKAAGELIDSIFSKSALPQARRAYTNNEVNTGRLGDLIDSTPLRRVEILFPRLTPPPR